MSHHITDPSNVVEKAETLIKENRFKEALLLYTDWLQEILHSSQMNRHKESIAIAYNNRGHLKYLMVDFDGAVQDYNTGLEYNSILPCIYYNRGTIMYRMGHFEQAVKDMIIAARLAPDCTDFQVALQRCKDQLIIINGPLHTPEQELLRLQQQQQQQQSEETSESLEGDENELEEQDNSLNEIIGKKSGQPIHGSILSGSSHTTTTTSIKTNNNDDDAMSTHNSIKVNNNNNSPQKQQHVSSSSSPIINVNNNTSPKSPIILSNKTIN